MSGERDPRDAGAPSPEPDEPDPQAGLADPGQGTPGAAAEPGDGKDAAAVEQPQAENMLPRRGRRRTRVERFLVRLVATGGIIGIGVAIGAIMVSSKSQGWLIGLVISVVSVVLAAILWSSREL